MGPPGPGARPFWHVGPRPGLRIRWPGDRFPQLVGQRRTLALRPGFCPADHCRDAGGAGAGLRSGGAARRCPRVGHLAATTAPTPRPRPAGIAALPKSRVTLVLVALVLLV